MPHRPTAKARVSAKILRFLPAIDRIICFETGEEIGLLYQWNNGETQVALYSDWDVEQVVADFEEPP